MSLPAITGFGDAELVTTISACAVVPTMVAALAMLLTEFGSLTEELTAAVSVITVPLATPEFTFTNIVNVDVVLPGMAGLVHTTLPVAPTAGVAQVQPAGAAIERNVVFAGTASTNAALSAALGPLLVTSCV